MESAGKDVSLSNGRLTVTLSPATGQITGIWDDRGHRYLSANEDRYDLDGTLSTEAGDSVVSQQVAKRRVTFVCVNERLRLRLEKVYQLTGEELAKEVRYIAEASDSRLLRVSSQSSLPPELYRKGFYYTPIDDGYKAVTVPYIPSSEITIPSAWTISTGCLVFYNPSEQALFAQYRYRINGGYVYSEAERGIESKYVPGGAITALGTGFIKSQQPLTVESRFLVMPGSDPRDFHKHILDQPPYSSYAHQKVPDWFPRVRMYFGDGLCGIGRGLVEDREAVAKDIKATLPLLNEDETLMIFFNHWSTSGDYPYQGNLRYLTYSKEGWSQPVPAERVKENIAFLKSLSPKIKVGGYVFFGPALGTRPVEEHKDWFVYEKDGQMTHSGDGIGECFCPDFASGYRDYALDQMKQMVTTLGFDWIHLDVGVDESVNWKTREVIQGSVKAAFYHDLGEFCAARNKAIVQNVATTTALWADGSYFECQQPDRWEKKDWRILGVTGFLSALDRTHKPGTWWNLVYGTCDAYAVRNAFSGLRGWTRGHLTWWHGISRSLAREKVIDELLETSLSDAHVAPSWWRFETDQLETEALQHGNGLIIPILLHGDKSSRETISLPTADLKYRTGETLFGFDMKLPPCVLLDPCQPIPWTEDRIELIGFSAGACGANTYTHTLTLEPGRNYYHLLTTTPAWVYSRNGERTSFLLPENQGVRITGRFRGGARRYSVVVENQNQAAQILAYLPDTWKAATVTANGQPVHPQVLDVLGARCLLIEVGAGKTGLMVRDSKQAEPGAAARYANPQVNVGSDTAARLVCNNLTARAYQETGRSCLALRLVDPANSGRVDLPYYPFVKTDGVAIWLKGQNSGVRFDLCLEAGGTWIYAIRDSFVGWKEFKITRDNWTASSPPAQWSAVSRLALILYPGGASEIQVANVCLLPPTPSEAQAAPKPKKRITARRITQPPVLDGLDSDACWKETEPVTGFYRYSSAAPAASETTVRAGYDDANLYVFFACAEPIDTLGVKQQRDTEIWNTDHVELYVDPYRDGVNWFQILVDPAGTIQDLKYSKTGRDYHWDGEFEVKTALNWKAGWTAEFKIPFRILGKTPKAGDVWGINFARKDIAGEFSDWATTGEWLDPAGFGEMEFSDGTRAAAAERPETNLLFRCSFDGSVVPEVHAGGPQLRQSGELRYVPGRFGQALVTGHGAWVSFPAVGNLDPRAGTVAFWVKPMNWNRNQQLFSHFFVVPESSVGAGRAFNVLLYKFGEWADVNAFGMDNELAGPNLLQVPMDDSWLTSQWHPVAFTWDSKGAGLFVDGKAQRRAFANQGPWTTTADEFKVGGPYFQANDSLTAIDELRIYSQPLTESELNRVFRSQTNP